MKLIIAVISVALVIAVLTLIAQLGTADAPSLLQFAEEHTQLLVLASNMLVVLTILILMRRRINRTKGDC